MRNVLNVLEFSGRTIDHTNKLKLFLGRQPLTLGGSTILIASYRFKVFITLLLITAGSLTFSIFATAQTAVTQIEIESAIAKVQQNTTLSENDKQQALADLTDAQDLLNRAQAQADQASEYENQALLAPNRISTINETIERTKTQSQAFNINRPIVELNNQLLLDLADQTRIQASIGKTQTQQTGLSLRPNEIAQALSALRADKAAIAESMSDKANLELEVLAYSKYLKRLANIEKLTATIEALERELSTVPARQKLIEAQLNQLVLQNKQLSERITELRGVLAVSQTSKIEKIIEQSYMQLEAVKESSILVAIAQENLDLAKAIERLQDSANQNEKNTSTLRIQLAEVQQSSQIVERVLATGKVTDELGELLRRLRASLPKEALIEARKATIEEDAVRHQLNVILWQERLRNLTDLPQAALQLLEQYKPHKNTASKVNPEPQFSQFEIQSAQTLATSRHALLLELIEKSIYQSERIIDEKLIINQLLFTTQSLNDSLERRLIWLPSNSGQIGQLWANLQNSLKWLLAPNSWGQLLNKLYHSLLSLPIVPVLLLCLALIIAFQRLRIKRTLWSLVDRVANVGKDTYLTTPLALLLTLVLALPLPLFLYALALVISKGSEPTSFSYAIGVALGTVSNIGLALLFFRSMSRKEGLFEKHFGWSDTSRKKLRSMLTWFVWLQCIAAFAFAVSVASGNVEMRYSLGLIAFTLGSIGIAIFSYQFFTPKNGVAATIVAKESTSVLTLFAFPIVFLSPLGIGLLPLFGFFDTAVELQSRVFASGILLVLAAVIYGVILRIFLVSFRRYILKKAHISAITLEEEKERAKAQNNSNDNTIESAAQTDKSINEEELMAQSRAVIIWTTGLLFVGGLWFVWRPILPALGIIDDIVLWQEIIIVDGVEVNTGVTLWNIIVSLALVIGGFVAAKNIRGLMEISFFERLEMDTGARYATMTILGYVLIATGTMLGFSQLGIEWSKLQWVVAALGVGLGFGLQEIVANFISGIIILFERPIRVGDLVTIGDLSGTVSNIKIRATTITDFDNREVLLPNKSIITENVTNWTLKDPITRVIIKIGVAYGSDIDQVRDLLLEVVQKHDAILKQPLPQVLFLEHGDSSLNFEVRIFVSSPQERLPLTHSVNTAINKILAKHNIAIPFPQRDVHIVSGQVQN